MSRLLPKFNLGVLVGAGGSVLTMMGIRSYRDSLLVDKNVVHKDTSQVSIAVQKQVVPTVKIRSAESESAVGRDNYTQFVHSSVSKLLAAQHRMEKEASRVLEEQLDKCFAEITPRAENFADWYFSYTTSFKLLKEATTSVARHALNIMDPNPLNEAVSADMDTYLTRKYERIVLRPEINDAQLQAAFHHCVKHSHALYKDAVQSVEEGMNELLATNTNHAQAPRHTDISLTFDWASQLHKIHTVPANYEKKPELSLLLSVGGAAIGKTLASKGASVATTKLFAGKLSAPFVAKAMAAGGGAAMGSFAGPAGTILGTAVGVGIDYTVNAGIGLLKREEFIKDVNLVIGATRLDYTRLLDEELHRVIGVWIEDAIHLLPKLYGEG